MISLTRAYLRFSDQDEPVIDMSHVSIEWSGLATLAAPSGAGKTTLFRLLAGWFTSNGKRVESALQWNMATPKDVKLIGLHAGLLPWLTVGHNFSLLTGRTAAEPETLLDEVGLEKNVFELYPYQLSLGMYKRVELIIAVLQCPELLLLDEYFTSVDDAVKSRVRDFIITHRKEKKTWVIAHEPALRRWISDREFGFKIDLRSNTITGLTS